MSGRDLTCEELRDGLGAELALGVLPAQERAAAIAHLDRCSGCRKHVEQMTRVSDGLLGLLPGTEPPVGFEKRVLGDLEGAARIRRRHRRLRALRPLAVGGAVALLFGFGGWTVGSTVGASPPASPPAATSTAEHDVMEANFMAHGHLVGKAFAYPGSPGWVYMSIGNRVDYHNESGKTATVTCQLVRTDGSTVSLGDYPLKDGRGHWGAPAPVNPATLSAARLLNANGSVLATAHFAASGR